MKYAVTIKVVSKDVGFLRRLFDWLFGETWTRKIDCNLLEPEIEASLMRHVDTLEAKE